MWEGSSNRVSYVHQDIRRGGGKDSAERVGFWISVAEHPHNG